MRDQAARLLELEERASRLLRCARDLPPGPKRQSFIEELQQFSRLLELKAKAAECPRASAETSFGAALGSCSS